MQIEGYSVKDARRNATFQILPRDIASARSKKPDKCAAALACCRELKADEVRVYVSRIYVRKGKQWTRYTTPDSLSREIVALDRGGRFEPGEYLLSRPPKSMQLGVETRTGRTNPKKNGKRRSLHHFTENIRVRPSIDRHN